MSSTVYDEDFVQWTAETARLLRERRFDQIDVEHIKLEVLFRDSPSLRAKVTRCIEDAYPSAVGRASDETGLPEDTFPARCPFTADQLLDPGFLPD